MTYDRVSFIWRVKWRGTMTTTELARHIEHSVLAPQATGWDVEEAARVAIRWHVRALVVKPTHVSLAARLLADTGVKVWAAGGVPHGGPTTVDQGAGIREAGPAGAGGGGGGIHLRR